METVREIQIWKEKFQQFYSEEIFSLTVCIKHKTSKASETNSWIIAKSLNNSAVETTETMTHLQLLLILILFFSPLNIHPFALRALQQ